MLTLPMILLLIKAWVPAAWGVLEPWWERSTGLLEAGPSQAQAQAQALGQRASGPSRGSRVRWVMPVQPALQTLPRPLVMDDPPPSSETRKKRL